MIQDKRKNIFRFLSITILISIALMSALLLYMRRVAMAADEMSSYHDPGVYMIRGDYDFAPFEFVNSEGKPDGYNIDIMNAVARAASINVKIDLGRWDIVRKQLENKLIDGLCGMLDTEERRDKIAFAEPTAQISYSLFTLKKSQIKSIEDVAGKKLIVQKGTLENDYAVKNKLTDKLIVESDWSKILPRLAAGEADCALFPTFIGINMSRERQLNEIIPAGPPLYKSPYCIAVPKEKTYLLFKFNEGLRKIRESGELEKIRHKWFGASEIEHEHSFKFLKYLLWTTIPLVIAVLFFFIWTAALKRQVISKTAELLEELMKRKRAQDELLKTKIYYQCIINSMPSILVGLDRNMMIVNMNWEAEKLTGLSSNDASGKKFHEIFSGYAEFSDDIKNSINKKIMFSKHKTFFSPDKKRTVVTINAYPLLNEGIAGAVIRIDDVTERTRFEEMMVQTEKMLSIGGLAAGMAHEINNPLGIIIHGADNIERRLFGDIQGNVQAAQECGVPFEKVKEYAEKRSINEFINDIKDGGQRASKIVSGMIQFRHGPEGSFVHCPIAKLVNESLALAASDYDLKGKYDFASVKINTSFESEQTGISCIPSQIKHVLFNMIKNSVQAMAAKKYTAPDTPTISIKTSTGNDMAEIVIEDNGAGMDVEVKRRIFEPFYTTHDVGEGTGLGLFVSYSIITEKHSGSISVDSQKGKFTRFTIKLPMEYPGTGETWTDLPKQAR
ncbi:MAG: transporter substrate-binding domain-containing protein [Candidatus Izemoplasmatales bacterium]|nr:transporter substrate-binding domain-containing protein [Candidatus Izemoplasmatales bacterium]